MRCGGPLWRAGATARNGDAFLDRDVLSELLLLLVLLLLPIELDVRETAEEPSAEYWAAAAPHAARWVAGMDLQAEGRPLPHTRGRGQPRVTSAGRDLQLLRASSGQRRLWRQRREACKCAKMADGANCLSGQPGGGPDFLIPRCP